MRTAATARLRYCAVTYVGSWVWLSIADPYAVTRPLPAVSVTPNATVFAGGLVLLGGAVAASVIPLLPLPGNSPAPRQAPSGPSAAFSSPVVADLAFAYPVDSGRSLSAAAPTEQIPSSPTFASDTTPD